MITMSARGTSISSLQGGMEPLPEGYAIVMDSEGRMVTDILVKCILHFN